MRDIYAGEIIASRKRKSIRVLFKFYSKIRYAALPIALLIISYKYEFVYFFAYFRWKTFASIGVELAFIKLSELDFFHSGNSIDT